jgi:hypothetical protein
MELSTTSSRIEKYTTIELADWDFNYNNDSVTWTNKEQSMYITNLMNGIYPEGSLIFSMYERENNSDIHFIDGQSRMGSIYGFVNGISRKGKQVVWYDGKKKVLYEMPNGNLKRGYRVMTDEERDFFNNITVCVNIYSFVNKPRVVRKRAREVEDDSCTSHKK